ncbi:hypothetical protein KFL_001010330 [Klebsormidium nitens]|uniref:Uncharacterized protein n=1 Tax=Klebsormidium nitens TaxID=105231 RepID=A0A1Y1I1Z4_KLENI|nr:hypothetical protein KFL_001010330 [Klebsormidium nitens]|eukprot:GAQ82148.1 hypothetical protein KFL_001010330 [Klebsormidium nitens]
MRYAAEVKTSRNRTEVEGSSGTERGLLAERLARPENEAEAKCSRQRERIQAHCLNNREECMESGEASRWNEMLTAGPRDSLFRTAGTSQRPRSPWPVERADARSSADASAHCLPKQAKPGYGARELPEIDMPELAASLG